MRRKKGKYKYLHERPFDILYRVVEELYCEYYSPYEDKWLKDEDPDEDVYLYQKQVDVLTEEEAIEKEKELREKWLLEQKKTAREKMVMDYKVTYGSDIVVLIKVGLNGNTSGHNNKYTKMAKLIHENTNYTVIIAPNPDSFEDGLKTDIDTVLKLVPKCESVIFVGVSNGAVKGMLYGHLYQIIKKMILINGPIIIDWHKLKKGISLFKGMCITFVYGTKDQSYKYVELLPKTRSKTRIELKIIGGADHNFTGMEEEFINIPYKYLA